MDLRTPLSKVKGLGSAKSGTHHWILQRTTAVALVFLVLWFVVKVISVAQTGSILDLLSSPVASVVMILFIFTALYHGCLGIRVIIEDYVHKNCVKTFLTLFCNFISIFLGSIAIISIITYHVNSVSISDLEKKKSYSGYQNSENFTKQCPHHGYGRGGQSGTNY